jgi:hypothetical protein
LAERQPLSEAQAYQRFYGLDFSTRNVRSGLGRFEVDGYEVVSQFWWPERAKATLFVFHGFYDHTGLYRHVIEWALDQGFAVIACDLPGHGLSSGERASIRISLSTRTPCRAVRGAIPGAAATVAPVRAKHRRRHRDRSCAQSGASSPAQGQVILLAPLVRPRAWGWSKFSYYLLKPFVKGIARRFSENSNDPNFCRSCRPIRCSHCVCRRLGSARWRAGSNASKPHRRAPAATDRAGPGGHDRGLAAQP